ALYDPAAHRSLTTRFGHDNRVAVLSYRSWALWLLGWPETSLADADLALADAREIGEAATLLYALFHASFPNILCGNKTTAKEIVDELVILADEKGSAFWKSNGIMLQGELLALAGKASDAVKMMTSGLAAFRSTGSTGVGFSHSVYLAKAYSDLGQFDDARRCIGEAVKIVKTTKERLWEAEFHRTIGEIALLSPERNTARSQKCFERALTIARRQQAKSWELRAAMSLARLWRDQGKVQQARELLAPVYGWFTEGFDTRDLKEAKALLEELAA